MESENEATCSSCGHYDENVSVGIIPYPHDDGMGICPDCVNWAWDMFFSTRFKIIEKNLMPDIAEKFRAWDYEKKVTFVKQLIIKGAMI